MSKKCPNCGETLPEEASFCLNCFTKLSEIEPDATNKKFNHKNHLSVSDKNKFKFSIKVSKNKRQAFLAIGLAVALVIVSVITVTGVLQRSNHNSNGYIAGNDITASNMVDSVGSNNSDDNSEHNNSNTTEKQGFFDKLFNNQPDSQTSNKDNTEDTTKNSLWQSIFGKPSTTTPGNNSSSVPHSTQKTAESSKVTITESNDSDSSIGNTTNAVVATSPVTQPSSDNNFSYIDVDGGVAITKYLGNSASVKVPAVIDGKTVKGLCKNAFSNNTSISSISFESSDNSTVLSIEEAAFNNLPNFKKLHFENSPKSLASKFITSCPSLSAIEITNSCGGYSTVDGVLFISTTLVYYPRGKQDSAYTIAARELGTAAICDNPYLKTVIISSKLKYLATDTNFFNCRSIERYSVDSANTVYLSKDDCVCWGSVENNNMLLELYPQGKKSTEFTFSEDFKTTQSSAFRGNTYLKTLRFNSKYQFNIIGTWGTFYANIPNLETVYVSSGTTADGAKYFSGTVKYN